MPLNYDKLSNWKIEDRQHSYCADDTILYALGLGFGQDPLDAQQLRFVYEKNLEALPTMATILGYPFGWLYEADAGVTRVKLVHAEQGIRILRPLPVAGDLVSTTEVTGIVDKGADKGALVYSQRKVFDAAKGDLLFTATATTFCRADGGFGGPSGPTKQVPTIPDRAPDASCEIATMPQAALIYRLNGDRNPLHVEPEVGRAAGFPGPILHGLCTFGVAGRAIMQTLCDNDTTRLIALDARFSAPVYPGEAVNVEMWRDGGNVAFRAKVAARDAVVLNNGSAEIRP